ncbi:LppM family (lipo)protein [Brevibacterium luteolum]|uniref:LppM family (lipo)protein n=1 Tax=Brevibacterium luteolum TaxID=199591 RepID=UPI00223B0F22|nr:hypothetical protein [Brevibacterium luteolum]MCT1874524.1 hypothetical protein [Brevibacterium luteolum]MCT1890845.1 hypothetical protein [Brevibacterium luteolum]MCT1894200.1 hypothetical protein [Brevibacterium luteolum]MCT1925059.1 hypothetical protein [Brevibacterium luteolum]
MTLPRISATRHLAVVVLLVLTVLLTGCMKINGDLAISRDLKVSGTVDALIERTAVEDLSALDTSAYGSSTGDADTLIDESIEEARQTLPAGVTVEKIADEQYIGARYTYDAVDPSHTAVEDFGLSGLHLSEQDDEITLRMPNFLLIDDAGPSNGSAGWSHAPGRFMFDEAKMTFTFPGRVISAPGGEVKGKTVTFDLRQFSGDTVTVTAKDSSFPWWVLFVVGGVLMLLIVAGVIIAVVARKKRQRQAMPPAPGYGGPGYGAGPWMPGPGGPGYGGQGYGSPGPGLAAPAYAGPVGAAGPPLAGSGVGPPHGQPIPSHAPPGPYGPPTPQASGPAHLSVPPRPGPAQPGQPGMPHPGSAEPGPGPAAPNDHRRFAPPQSRTHKNPPEAD